MWSILLLVAICLLECQNHYAMYVCNIYGAIEHAAMSPLIIIGFDY